jgi:zinc protease
VDAPHATETHLVVAGVGAARSTPDYAALEVMNAVLGGLFSSRINLNLREAHAYTYGAGSEFVYRKFPGPFWVTGSVDTPNTAPAVIEIFKELRRMRDTRMSPAELSMARDALVRALPDDFETGPSTVMALSRLFVYGLGLDYYVGLPGSLSAVTAESAQAAAQKYLDVDGMLVVAVGDRAAIEPKLRKLELGPIDTWLVQ